MENIVEDQENLIYWWIQNSMLPSHIGSSVSMIFFNLKP